MSIDEQTELDTWTEQPDVEPDVDARDTHGRDAIRQSRESDPDMGRQCGACGAHVSQRFIRVLGPEEGQPEACPECTSVAAIRRGAAVHGDAEGRAEDVDLPTEEAQAAFSPTGIKR